MNERDFIEKLKNRAKDQEKIMQAMPFPHVFSIVSIWLGNHPWRILIPFAFLLSLIFHFLVGNLYDTFVLKIFGGLGLTNYIKEIVY